MTHPPRKVLIIKPSSLGDVVTALPVLRGLRRTFPQARISWLLSAGCAPLLEGDGDLDEIILFDRRGLGRWWRSTRGFGDLWRFQKRLRHAGFDWVIDLQGLLRSSLFAAFSNADVRAGFVDPREKLAGLFYTHKYSPTQVHTVGRNVELARQMGIDAKCEEMTLKVTPAGRAFAESTCCLHNLRPGGFIVAVPPTRWRTKLYPPRHWRSVIQRIIPRCPVVIAGTPADEPMCREISAGFADGVVNLAGKTNVPQLVGLLSAAGAVICSDSAAMYIAPAVAVPVVALLGPTRPERTGPVPPSRMIISPAPCRGCLKRRCRHVTCMELITPAEVARVSLDILEPVLADKKSPCGDT